MAGSGLQQVVKVISGAQLQVVLRAPGTTQLGPGRFKSANGTYMKVEQLAGGQYRVTLTKSSCGCDGG